MKFFIVLALVSAASSARLDNVFLPPNARSSSGANAGLQTPYGGAAYSGGQAYGGNQAEILRYENEINEEGYHYAFETSDGTKAEQQGRVYPGAQPEEGSLAVSGSYSYVGDDGQTYTVTYIADENGYRAEGAHLPTPPPIPAEILKSLQYTDSTQGTYQSRKSSYDADAGY
ncbi:endocuticle structural glycoprotein SgAbd-3-like [Spodoptera litura]|uniref:Endocuticle structural glycoprotein SgAbd-3-like n=1 Tax=Spodoptera litura TaxID=69820 RepID=A0A9J7DRH8_SPOLT|nr:endocuticle structural glycoprotein SgAbd-3-like [Spodoptera litura]